MEKVENKEFVYEFGKFVLDPKEKTLFADGVAIHLPAKEFDTLLLLIQNNGHALSKEEMLTSIWQDAFVEEGNLVKQISRLRKIFNTNGNQLIETVPKHGYRFSTDLRRVARPDDELPVIAERRVREKVTISVTNDVATLGEQRYLPPATRSFFSWQKLLIFAVIATAGLSLYLLWQKNEPAKKVNSIAVLPLRSLIESDENRDVALGLTDVLITKLGSLKQMVVRPTNAVRNYTTTDPREAGRELGVDAVLEGNVQRLEKQIRVTVQLVSVSDGALLWGGTFDEEFTDPFHVQDAIVTQVASALELEFSGVDQTRPTKTYTANPEAHYAYVKGRIAWNRRTSKDFEIAIAHYNDAIIKDPNYALAYAGLADAYSLLADYRGANSLESYQRAKTAASKALELNDTLAEAHTAMAYVNMYHMWDFESAERNYKRAIAINVNYATAHQWYSEFLAAMGRFDEALVEIRRAKEIDPLSPIINAGEVWVLYYARRYDEAIEHGQRLAEANPQFAEVHEYLKRCYDQKGMYKEAIASRQTRRRNAGLDPAMTPPIARAAASASPQIYWKSRLEQELEDSHSEPPSTFDLAEIYAQLGDNDKAFYWLEKGFAERIYSMMYLRVAPNLDPIRNDPRFTDLLQRIGFA